MVFIITLAYYEYDIGHTIATAVNLYELAGLLQLYYLMAGKMVSVKPKSQTIDRNIKLSLILLGQLMLYLSYCITGEEPMHSHLVIPGLTDATI